MLASVTEDCLFNYTILTKGFVGSGKGKQIEESQPILSTGWFKTQKWKITAVFVLPIVWFGSRTVLYV